MRFFFGHENSYWKEKSSTLVSVYYSYAKHVLKNRAVVGISARIVLCRHLAVKGIFIQNLDALDPNNSHTLLWLLKCLNYCSTKYVTYLKFS